MCFPQYKMQELIENGTIGRVRSTNAHLGMDVGLDEKDASDRLINHNLAGGSILDLGCASLPDSAAEYFVCH